MVSGKTMILGMMGIACSLLMACSSKQKDYLDEMPVIAEKVTLPTGDLIVCDLAKATDTLDVPLSMLTEELQIFRSIIRMRSWWAVGYAQLFPISIFLSAITGRFLINYSDEMVSSFVP